MDIREENLLKIFKSGNKIQKEEAAFELCCLYQRKGQPQKALTILKNMLADTDDNDKAAEHYLNIGRLMENMEDFVSATSYYYKAMALGPSNLEIWYFIHNNLGYCLNVLGKYKEAEQFLEKAIKILPPLPNAYKNMGLSLEGQNCYEEAAFYYMCSMAVCPDDLRPMQHLENLISRRKDMKLDYSAIRKFIGNFKELVKDGE
ncbi:MAG: hypothetical protein JW976_14045 [Syntrophaceae bacterium]|nr:hypothetical protein [Syntrophaceae bacterium]